ncbi:MAG: hypothetical protein HY814_04450 [Candidatus Riflebacteria bacterium]|nr:hypothetical protein [Candidatus Riflebacteria bacterium]
MFSLRPTVLVLAITLIAAPWAAAQSPGFDDLPAGSSESSLAATVKALTLKVQDLEKRLQTLEGRGTRVRSMSGDAPAAPTTDSPIDRLVNVTLKGLQEKLEAFLDGHHFADPGDKRYVYWKIRNNGDWPKVTEAIRQFAQNMAAIPPLHKELSPEAAKLFADLCRWGRGRILYKAGIRMDQMLVLEPDFGAVVVPVE